MLTMRTTLVKMLHSGTGFHKVFVRHDPVWDEYRCVPEVGGVPQHDATYFTSDKADALRTAEALLASMPATYPELKLQPYVYTPTDGERDSEADSKRFGGHW